MLALNDQESVIHSLNHKLILSENCKSDQNGNVPKIQLQKNIKIKNKRIKKKKDLIELSDSYTASTDKFKLAQKDIEIQSLKQKLKKNIRRNCVKEYVNIVRCFSYQRLENQANHWKSKLVCAHCTGENHTNQFQCKGWSCVAATA